MFLLDTMHLCTIAENKCRAPKIQEKWGHDKATTCWTRISHRVKKTLPEGQSSDHCVIAVYNILIL